MPQTNKLKRGRRKTSKPWYKRKYNALQLAQKAASGVMYLKGLVNAEKKFHDVSVNAAVSWNGSINHITAIAGGSGENQRNGNSIFARYVSLRGVVNSDPAAAVSTVRMLVIIDKDSDSGTPTFNEILGGAGTIFAPFANINDDNRRRFKVLTTKLMTFSNAGQQSIPFKAYIPLKHHVRWNSSTSTDIDKGHVYVVFVSTVATNTPSMVLQSRVAYYDN